MEETQIIQFPISVTVGRTLRIIERYVSKERTAEDIEEFNRFADTEYTIYQNLIAKQKG